MLAATPTPIAAVKPPQPVTAQTAHKTTQPQAPETARTSAGEPAAANLRSESAQAVQAAEQGAIAPRLRDQERAETTDRSIRHGDAPAGPPPAFEESPLERQARVALDPPDIPSGTAAASADPPDTAAETETSGDRKALAPARQDIEPPPTPTERAEAGFAETRTIADRGEPVSVDLRN